MLPPPLTKTYYLQEADIFETTQPRYNVQERSTELAGGCTQPSAKRIYKGDHLHEWSPPWGLTIPNKSLYTPRLPHQRAIALTLHTAILPGCEQLPNAPKQSVRLTTEHERFHTNLYFAMRVASKIAYSNERMQPK